MASTAPPLIRRRSWAATAVGILLALLGAVLLIGGIWLLALGGSPYYAAAGAGLVLSGWLIMTRRLAGALLYGVIFIATVIWAFWESGTNPWALVPRVVGPAVLLLLVILVTPLLSARVNWKGAGAAFLAALVILIGGGVIAGRMAPDAVIGGIPPARGVVPLSVATQASGSDWTAYGGTYGAQRYSTLAQITPGNVARLERAWVYHTGDLPTDMKNNKYGAETTPLKIGDTVYLCSAKNILIALDAASGQQKWRFDPGVPDAWIPYTAACRGVAYHDASATAAPATAPRPAPPLASPSPTTTACRTRIIEGTLDARLIAVDAATGQPCRDFGTNGQVDLKVGLGQVDPGMVSVTSAPTIVRGVIVVGHQVLDGQQRNAPSGVIRGYDVTTGALRWAWDMVNPQWTGMPPEGQEYARGTPNMWTTASGDEALGLVYLPMGNSAVDYWSGTRSPQEKRFSTSLVAIDVATGRPAWSFQTVRNDVWDYDLGSQATLVDLPAGNGAVPALILPSKQGDIYILDRRTGRPLTPVANMTVPGGGVEPAQRSPTQPVSLYHTLRKADLQERDMWGMSPIDQMICRIQFRRAHYDGFYTPPTADRRWIQYPGYNGGSDWGGIAIDPQRGVIIANYNDMPNYNRLVPRAEADAKGWETRAQIAARGGSLTGKPEGKGDPQAGTPYAIDVNAGWRLPFTNLLCKEPPYGGIRAIDMMTGKTIWDRPFGSARRNGPFNIPTGIPFDIGTPNNGGGVVTAGGLMFIAATTDNLIRAIDVNTGKTLWQDVLPAGGQATPVTYEAGGRQYVVIMAGGHHFMETPVGDAVIAYALPQR